MYFIIAERKNLGTWLYSDLQSLEIVIFTEETQ